MTSNFPTWTSWILITVLALALRLPDLEERPMHTDEATGAYFLAAQLQGQHATFNPKHFHGPLLRVMTEPWTTAFGEDRWQTLSASTLRLSTVFAGLLLCYTPLLWRKEMGAAGACLAGACLASSPLLVYYSRMYIHETWLALFGMLACNLLYRFYQNPNRRRGVLAGVCIGLMFATKETFIISLFCWAIALIACLRLDGLQKLFGGDRLSPTPLIALALSALATATLFYTNWFQQPLGIIDAFRTFFVYETTAGHDKPLNYYAALLLWPKSNLGICWSEVSILLLPALCLTASYRSRRIPTALCYLTLASALHFMVYSLIAYKTPWLALLPWAQTCLLAGFACTLWSKSGKIYRTCLVLLAAITLIWQSQQSSLVSGRYANDSRNPYAYVPTSKDIAALPAWLNALHKQSELNEAVVIGKSFWPLPWYLRPLDQVSYWPSPRAECSKAPLVFTTIDQAQASDALLQESHMRFPRGLRRDEAIIMYLRRDIWLEWIAQEHDE